MQPSSSACFVLRASGAIASASYWIDKLIERFGPDITLPDLRHELARCPRQTNMSDPCQVGYVDRVT